jgi:hypothetical protein
MALELNGTTGVSLVQSSATSLQSMQVFNTAGSHTWTKPAGVTKVKVYVTGGGGGGGGGGATTADFGASGGAGGTAIKIIDVSEVSSVAVTVGAGGVGGSSASQNNNGTDGSDSSFGTYCSGLGGDKGVHGNTGPVPGGLGGNATGGDLNLIGGDGGPGYDNSGLNTQYAGALNQGGSSYWGGGGSGGSFSVDGAAGKAYGSGGGGGQYERALDGGDGQVGVVVVEEYA